MTEARSAKPVRVFVTYEALSELDPSNVRDMHGASENFERFRLKVEKAAGEMPFEKDLCRRARTEFMRRFGEPP